MQFLGVRKKISGELFQTLPKIEYKENRIRGWAKSFVLIIGNSKSFYSGARTFNPTFLYKWLIEEATPTLDWNEPFWVNPNFEFPRNKTTKLLHVATALIVSIRKYVNRCSFARKLPAFARILLAMDALDRARCHRSFRTWDHLLIPSRSLAAARQSRLKLILSRR